MRWGYGKSKEEMRRVHSGGSAGSEEGVDLTVTLK